MTDSIMMELNQPYEIRIGSGLLSEAGADAELIGRVQRAAVVSDETVFSLYGEPLLERFREREVEAVPLIVPSGETSKTLENFGMLVRSMAGKGFTRQDLVVAFGGGTVGDLAGFAAATYERGLRYMQIPTTLLSAVDASVGGKTAIDLPEGKNLIGAFHQPSLVLTDTALFDTLPEKEYLNGVSEILKCGMIADEDLFRRFAALPVREDYRTAVVRSVLVKKRFVEMDERDEGPRMLLNFGHTFAHAAEAASGFTMPHGQAVSIGMVIATRAAVAFGKAPEETLDALLAALNDHGLPTEMPFTAAELLPHFENDKKRRGDSLTLILPKRIGEGIRVKVPLSEMRRWLEAGGVL